MPAWCAHPDHNTLRILESITAQPVALTTIAQVAPVMRQPATPSTIRAYLQEQRTVRCTVIEALAAEITALNAVHNALFPTACHLPPEMLSEIFSYLRNDRPGTRSNRDLLNALATCKRWREVGCGVPRLWNEISLHNPSLVKASLERSRTLPLVIYLENKRCRLDPQRVAKSLLPHIGRIETLDISCPDIEALEIFCSGLNVPAPLLKALRIGYTSIGAEEVVIDPPFGGNMPSLRTLALDRVLLPPSPLWASNLEDLSMRDTIPSLQDMLDLLEQCTSLRTLLVDGYHTWPEDDSRPDHEPVSLPSLKLLDVRTQPLPASEDLLANLILPDAATLRLEVDMMTDDAHPVQLPDMRLCPNIPCIRGLKRIEVLWSNRNCILIRGFRNAQEHVAPDIEVVISAASDFLDLPYDWYLDLSQVEVLVFRLGGMGANSFESWDILQNFPELTTFRLIEPDAPSLFGLLNGLMDTREVQMPDQAGTQRNHRLCPRLHTLELFDFRWTAEIGAAMENMVAVRQTFEPKAFRFLDVYNAKDGPTGHHFVGPHDANVSQVLVVTNAE